MTGFDFSGESRLWKKLLAAEGICFWRNDLEGVAIPVGCAPERWIDAAFQIDADAANGWHLESGEAAADRLPLVLRSRLDYLPAATLIARAGDKGGLFAVWRERQDVPAAIDALAELAQMTCSRLLDLADQADFALDAHMQLRSLLDALPQGVIIVPNRSRRGFANPPAARWLGMPAGELDIGTLAARLGSFAERALNAKAVLASLRPHLSGPGANQPLPVDIWRFASPPHALRVTVAPLGGSTPAGWVWLLDDISAEELARDQLRQREEHFRQFFQSLQQDAVVYTDPAGRLLEWNEPFRQLLGYGQAALATLHMADLVVNDGASPGPVGIAEELAAQTLGKAGEAAKLREKRLRCADGRIVTVESRAIVRTDEQGRAIAMWEVIRDISERKAAEAQILLAAQAFDRANDGVLLLSPQLTILTANNTFLALSRYSREALVGHPLDLLRSNRHGDAFYARLREVLQREGHWQGEVWQRRRDGGIFLKWLSISALRDEHGAVTHYLAMFRDPETEKEAHARLEYLATHDELTGLPNRMLFNDHFQITLGHAARSARKCALLMVDLDEFKGVNESFGHRVGDKVLREVAGRLLAAVRQEDSLARWGADEFVVLADIESVEEAAVICTNLLDDLARTHAMDGLNVWVPACIGISVYPNDGNDIETLMRKAETAMHRAKALGKNTYCFFTEDMAERALTQLRLESQLRHALGHGELYLVYQPQIDPAGGRLKGCEALMRWQRDGELIMPNRFIPAAERSGLIVELTDWALAEAFRQVAAWERAGVLIDTVSVNTSARHFLLAGMVERVTRMALDAGVDPGRICLEITEGVLMEAERSEQVLADLKQVGFHVSVDDFGTGYSSLAYLKRFPIDELKIDKSFVDGIETHSSDRAIVSATLAMAHSLGMRVVAEGVENEEQQDYLKSRNCDLVQGYLHSRPLRAEDFLRFAAGHAG